MPLLITKIEIIVFSFWKKKNRVKDYILINDQSTNLLMIGYLVVYYINRVARPIR